MLAHARGEGRQEALGSMLLQEGEAALDILPPLGRAPMNQFGQPGLGRRAEFPQTLALVVR